ncbi:hypothetical protein M0L20_17880 [Spirosoma sp. RP8]|uniref:Uncharacterized protein n=1 Tax=Spirosoma liriopis TaxID=2937440 RepID=A0ABT0HNJ5_9BACT|nr:hypothetical protein [Spirosoma liriopis]MCK8493742.1 hypothetical protein [Spirosoma liriopis]
MNQFTLTNRTLGAIGLLGAHYMLIAPLLPMRYPALAQSAFDGLVGLFFMLTWMGSLVGLIRLNATGNSSFGYFMIRLNLLTLAIANIWNIYQALDPNANTVLYRILDAFWPICMVVMLLVGIIVVRAGTLRGWRRYVPLAVGMWLPLTALVGKLMGSALVHMDAVADNGTLYILLISGAYASICWSLLAYLVWTTPQPQPISQM